MGAISKSVPGDSDDGGGFFRAYRPSLSPLSWRVVVLEARGFRPASASPFATASVMTSASCSSSAVGGGFLSPAGFLIVDSVEEYNQGRVQSNTIQYNAVELFSCGVPSIKQRIDRSITQRMDGYGRILRFTYHLHAECSERDFSVQDPKRRSSSQFRGGREVEEQLSNEYQRFLWFRRT